MANAETLPILLVDDDDALRRTMEDVLVIRGFAPRTAPDGRRALSIAKEMLPPPAVAVVDLRLPDMDGLDLASQLQTHTNDLQVVILTGNASIESALRAVRDQGCDYLVKPVQPDDLVKTLRAAENRWKLHRAEEELHQTQSMVRAVFEASPLPMSVVDRDIRVRLWNRAAEQVFGWSAEEVIGHPPPIFLPSDEKQAREIAAAALGGESFTGVEVRRRRKDGVILDLRLSVAGLANWSGQMGALLAVYEDITERRRIEVQLQQAQRLDAVGRLAGGIAHDFNNLLAVIRTETDLALRESDLDPRAKESLVSVRETADRGATLTRQLLAFARRQPMEPAVIDPNSLVTDLDRMLQRLIGGRIELRTDLAEDIGHVKVDRGQLEQVLTNLTVNARDAMPEGGRLAIMTRNEVVQPGESRFGLDTGEWVVMSVADTGSGIPEDLRSRIFEPFFTTKERGSGTGLGLATSYGIVHRFGGLISVESEVGRGSTFRICLPRVDHEADTRNAGGPVEAPSGTETILLVEDHVELRSATRKILMRQGYSVYAVGDGAEAWRVVRQLTRPPHLIVVDAHLPDGDGRDLILTLQEKYPGLKALLTSGSFEVAKRDDVPVPFLEKPYTLEGIAQAVRGALDGTYVGPSAPSSGGESTSG